MSIEFRIEKGIAELTFDDGKVNAMDMQWWQLAISLLDQIKAKRPKALIIRGREKIFCAGVNLKMITSLDRNGIVESMNLYNEFINRIRCFPCPTVAQITGSTIAGGCMILCACDYVIAVKGDYKIHLNEHINGMPLPAWCVDICAARFSEPHLTNFTLLAQPFTAEQAHTIGVVNELADNPQDLANQAYEAATRLSKLNTNAYAMTKSRIRVAIEPHGQ